MNYNNIFGRRVFLLFSLNFVALGQSRKTEQIIFSEIMKFQKAFLSDWLIKKNVDKALKYFHEEAFISKAMYTADCASFGARDFYIKPQS